MAIIELHRERLETNHSILQQLFRDHHIEWAAVTKLLCGNEAYLREVIRLGLRELCDARISNLKKIKAIDPTIETVYIKPPARKSIPNVVRYADASFNTELQTIRWLNEEAQKQGYVHKVIIMVELGDLREGVMGEDLLGFYKEVFELPNIEVTGLGSNLNCLYGVMPSEDKLIQLHLYKQLIESVFNRKIKWISGGTSVVIPLLMRGTLPAGINHFRVGETLFFGANLFEGGTIDGMRDDVFVLHAELIEIAEKPLVPTGQLEENPSGEQYEIDEEDYGKTTCRGIIDIGVLDVSDPHFLMPFDPTIQVLGASSDMIILDLGSSDKGYQVGDTIPFRLKYMGALRLFNSDYIEKRVIVPE